MLRKTGFVLLSLIFMFLLTGCATGRRQKELETQGLRNQISVLESQVQAKDEEILNLREELSKATETKETLAKGSIKKRVIAEVKSRPKARQIQIALNNAGFNPGNIDGRMGRQTREAVRAFQRANNLAIDGKVGKQTWALLKEYLYKKIK